MVGRVEVVALHESCIRNGNALVHVNQGLSVIAPLLGTEAL